MGAEEFTVTVRACSAVTAFKKAVKDAKYDFGHGGYTGSIAEKDRFKMVVCPKDEDPEEYAQQLMDADDHWASDKWGPAGCIKIDEESEGPEWEYLFFGWASS